MLSHTSGKASCRCVFSGGLMFCVFRFLFVVLLSCFRGVSGRYSCFFSPILRLMHVVCSRFLFLLCAPFPMSLFKANLYRSGVEIAVLFLQNGILPIHRMVLCGWGVFLTGVSILRLCFWISVRFGGILAYPLIGVWVLFRELDSLPYCSVIFFGFSCLRA